MTITSNEGSEVTTPTIRWTSHAMYLSDQGNGDSCWVLYGDYVKSAQAALIAFSEQVAKCNFVDDHGHPLKMNAAYISLCSALNGNSGEGPSSRRQENGAQSRSGSQT